MICKIAEPDIETEPLSWQTPIAGKAKPASGTPGRHPGQSAPSAESLPGGGSAQEMSAEMESLRRRIAELDALRMQEANQARQSGHDQGLRQARQEAAAEMEAALDRLARAIQEVAQVKRRVRADAEGELVKLALAIAQRILHREINTDPQALRGLVYAALQRLQNRDILRIRVSPAGVPAVRAALERIGNSSPIEIIADAMLQPGGLLVETSLGELDASVETQLQEIERGFADRLQLR